MYLLAIIQTESTGKAKSRSLKHGVHRMWLLIALLSTTITNKSPVVFNICLCTYIKKGRWLNAFVVKLGCDWSGETVI